MFYCCLHLKIPGIDSILLSHYSSGSCPLSSTLLNAQTLVYLPSPKHHTVLNPHKYGLPPQQQKPLETSEEVTSRKGKKHCNPTEVLQRMNCILCSLAPLGPCRAFSPARGFQKSLTQPHLAETLPSMCSFPLL